MKRVISLFFAATLLLFGLFIGSKILPANKVENALSVLERSLQEPDKFPPTRRISENYLALEKSAVQIEAKELFRRARTEQVFRAALDYDNRSALLGNDATALDHSELKSRLWEKINDADTENRLWLKGVLKKIGWFRISIYGRAASNTAWLLVQHADQDKVWQKEILRELKPMVNQGDVAGIDVAYLEDRIAAAAAQPQFYGTQGVCEDGVWSPLVIADPDHVDERRRALGLESMKEYRLKFEETCKGE